MTKKKEKENLSDLSVDELIDKWKQIKGLLDSLEDDYRKAEISESAYKEAKEKNEKKHKQLTEILAGWGITQDQIDSKPAGGAGGGEPGGGEKPTEEQTKATKTGAASAAATAATGTPKPTAVSAPAQPQNQQQPQSQPVPATAPYQPPSQPGVSMDVVEAKMDGKMEKLSANIETLKETNAGLSERMQIINESIGELRSQGAQREGIIKDNQSKIETLDDEVSAINPQKYSKALEKRDKNAGRQDMRIEKLEMKTSEIAKMTGDIRRLLESVGGLENVATVSKDIGKKMGMVSQTHDDMQKLANRVEKMYVHLNRRMEDFAIYRSKQENIEGVVKDIIKSIDAVSVRLDDYVTVPNFDNLKKGITDLEIRIGTLQEMIGKIIPVARMKIPQPIRELQEEKEAIQSIMDSLETEYAEGRMKKESYDLVKTKNTKKMNVIEAALKNEWARFEKLVTRAVKGGGGQQEAGPDTSAAPAASAGSGESLAESPGSSRAAGAETTQEAGLGTEGATEGERYTGKPIKKVSDKPAKPSKPIKAENMKMGTVKTGKPSEAKKQKPGLKQKAIPKTKPKPKPKPKPDLRVTVKLAKQDSPKPKKPKPALETSTVSKLKQPQPGKPVKPVKPQKLTKKKANTDTKPKPKTKPDEVSKSMMAMRRMEKSTSKKLGADKTGKKADKAGSVTGATSEKDSMLSALEDSYKKGLLSKEAYERTKKMLSGKQT